uniref:Uncharacterized protein n=1 Tax=Arundo donax TaxID=35708 RepID=A0A0A8XPH5_ARUDO
MPGLRSLDSLNVSNAPSTCPTDSGVTAPTPASAGGWFRNLA